MGANCKGSFYSEGDIEWKLNISEEQEILVDYQDLGSKQIDDMNKCEEWFGVNLRNSMKKIKISYISLLRFFCNIV